MTPTRILENDSEQLGLLKKLEEDVNEVIVLIGSNSQGWQKQLRKKHLTDEHRLRLRRRFLAAGVANTFGWLSRHGLGNPSNRLMDLQGTLLAMFNIGKESKIPLLSRDKISYMNVKFAFDFHGLQSCRLDQDLVKSFCRELVTENVDFAEPYFFFLLLFWPGLASPGESTTSPDTFDLLEECIGRLKDFERRHSEAQLRSGFNFQQQPRFLLYLRLGRQQGQGGVGQEAEEVRPGERRQGHVQVRRYAGRQQERGHELPGGRRGREPLSGRGGGELPPPNR